MPRHEGLGVIHAQAPVTGIHSHLGTSDLDEGVTHDYDTGLWQRGMSKTSCEVQDLYMWPCA